MCKPSSPHNPKPVFAVQSYIDLSIYNIKFFLSKIFILEHVKLIIEYLNLNLIAYSVLFVKCRLKIIMKVLSSDRLVLFESGSFY